HERPLRHLSRSCPPRRAPRRRRAPRPQRSQDPSLPPRAAAAQRPRHRPRALRAPAPRLRLIPVEHSLPREYPGGMENEKTGPSFGARILAAVVLAVAAYILFKVIIGIVAGIAWFLVVVVAAIAVIWAVRTLF